MIFLNKGVNKCSHGTEKDIQLSPSSQGLEGRRWSETILSNNGCRQADGRYKIHRVSQRAPKTTCLKAASAWTVIDGFLSVLIIPDFIHHNRNFLDLYISNTSNGHTNLKFSLFRLFLLWIPTLPSSFLSETCLINIDWKEMLESHHM